MQTDLATLMAPPTPTSVDSSAPSQGPEFVLETARSIPDVNARPLYGFVPVGAGRRTPGWHNYDRRGMSLTVLGQWQLVMARTISSQTGIDESIELEEGISTTESEERTVATNFGISVTVPYVDLGLDLSRSISETVSTSVTTHKLTRHTTTLTATTDKPNATFWFWQLQSIVQIDGTHIVFGVEDSGYRGLLATPGVSQAVNTIDGPGRELNGGRRVPARRLYSQNFTQRLPTKDPIYRTTQYPPASINVMMTDTTGNMRFIEETTPTSPTADQTIEALQREMSALV